MADFSINDKRASRRGYGIVVGETVEQAKQAAGLRAQARAALDRGRAGPADDQATTALARSMRSARSIRRAGSVTSDISMATGRPRDPMFYWKQNNLPYETDKPDGLKKVRDYCRVLYRTHPVIASAIDIYSKYPLVGMEFTCKDKALTEFYTTLFFDQLNYEDFLIDVGREHWSVGEAWPLGSFNEDLGVWEDDELLNPDDVEMHRSPFLKEPRFLIRLPETLRKVIRDRAPEWEFKMLMRSYPELAAYANDDRARMPVSNVLLKQIKFKGDTFNPRGVPILTRGFRAIMQEEMLNAAQDAIAARLYTPLILAKLGASATDLGTTSPWIPNDEDLMAFEDALDAALSADFRVLTHHFAVQMDSVFGRETMPNFDPDFERLTEKQLQVFGLSKTMLSGAQGGQTYAADALNRDLISQLLTTYQRQVKRFVRDRMLVVAEAQEHYDYEVRGGKRYPVMEEVLEVDEETGEQRIVEQPKLLVPDLNLKAMNMRDDQSQRQFYEALRASGVPISMRTRMVNVPIDLSDEIDTTREEQVQLAVEAQETRRATYQALKAKNLPIPDDLREDFEPKALGAGGEDRAAAERERPALLGIDAPDTAALVPTPDVLATPPGQPLRPGPGGAQVIPLTRNKIMEPGRTRPPESDEMRAGMPRPAVKVAAAEGEEPPPTGRLIDGPKHVGMRRYAQVSKDEPLPGGEDEPVEEAGA